MNSNQIKSNDPQMDTTMLRSDHEEADVRVILHCINSPARHNIVCTRDTDIVVLLLVNYHRMQCKTLWVKAGTSKNRQYIPIHDVHKSLAFEQETLEELLAYHALTGCDTVIPHGPF